MKEFLVGASVLFVVVASLSFIGWLIGPERFGIGGLLLAGVLLGIYICYMIGSIILGTDI